MTDPMRRHPDKHVRIIGNVLGRSGIPIGDDNAERIVKALAGAGCQIAPLEPTNVQTDHGMRALDLRIDPRRAIKAVYRAMLAAAGADCQGCRLGWPLRRDTETGEMCHWADPRTNVGPCAAAGGSDE